MANGYPTLSKYRRSKQIPLQFSKDGKFRILHLTDIHAVMPEMDDEPNREIPLSIETETQNVITECIRIAKPDLVVFGGDNISGYWQEFTYELVVRTINKIVKPVADADIPLAIVFGNHDSEIGLHREIQMCIYSDYANCRASLNAEEMYGCGTYDLQIKSSDGKRDAYCIWCIDSNDYPRDENGNQLEGYDCVHEDQLAWFQRRSEQLRQANGGEPLPSVLFQHIPVNQEYEFIKEAPKNAPGAIEKNGIYYVMEGRKSGVMREFPCPPAGEHNEQLEGWVTQQNVVAAFFGHDHTNTFTVNYKGIDLVQTIGAGYASYGKERGGRLIILDENNPRHIESQTIIIPRVTTTDLE